MRLTAAIEYFAVRKSKLKVAVTDESEVLNFVAMTLYVAGDTFSIHESVA